jgi:hypothetical protein
MSARSLEQNPLLARERWGRLPPEGGRLRTLSRTALDRLTRPSVHNDFDPPVASKVISISGGKRHIRLIDLDDLDRWIEAQSDSSLDPKPAPKKPSRPKTRRRKVPTAKP